MKKFINEFKELALKGNVMNLAVGVLIGAAFQNVVTSLTTNILSPVIGLFMGHNFDTMVLNIFGVTFMYGAFITSVINFFITAFVVFMLVRLMNKIMSLGKKQPETQEPTTKKCPFCITDININATKCPACTSQLESTN